MRAGVIAQKLGMTRVFTPDGQHIPVTVLKLDQCQVVAHKTVDKHRLHRLAARGRFDKSEESAKGGARTFFQSQDRTEAQAGRISSEPG